MTLIDWERRPDRYCVVSSLPRSGSTLLSYALEDTGLAGRPREYFGPRKESGYARKWSLPRQYSLRSFLKATAASSMTANGVCAVKIHLYDFLQVLERASTEFGSSLDERELLEICFPGARYIFVRREDRVRQSISFLRAMDSMQWQRLHGEQAVSLRNSCDGGCEVLRGRRLRHAGRGV
jgi:LPS sulfotransferase NodH